MERKIKHFKTNVLLKSIIGKDLINDDNIAILELIKNSYDANSKEVKLIFKNIKSNDDAENRTYSKNSSKIIIQDYGVGMDEEDLEGKWLNIAYSEKKIKKIQYNRVLAGAKGVGRFSCDRLGEYLDIYTRKKNKDIFHLFVDWKSFEIDNQQDLQIQDVNIVLTTIREKEFKSATGFDPFEKGTILEISKLRNKWAVLESNNKGEDRWNVDKLLNLKKSLEKLINPNQAFNRTSFKIFLSAEEFIKEDRQQPEYKQINCEVKSKIFEKLDFTSTSISASIDESGKVITTTITDKGRDIFILQELNVSFTFLKNVNIVLYYLNTYSKMYFARQTGIRSVDFGSVYLFINGFRIPPYGEFGDDWLGLEIRKGQGYARFLGTRELIGRIEVKDNESKFKIVSSREGLVKDRSFNQLTDQKDGFFYYTLRRLERYVVDGLDWDRVSKKSKRAADVIDDPNHNKAVKEFISQFERKLNSKNWQYSPNDEKYYEDQITKNRRILSLIDYIIDVKPENIIDLYINKELVTELVKEEQQRAQQEFDKIIRDIPELSEEQIFQLVEKIKKEKLILDDSIKRILEVSNINRETSLAFKRSTRVLASTEKDITKYEEVVQKLNNQKLEAEEKQKKEAEAREKAEQEKRELELKLAIEQEKNTYLRATSKGLTEDAKGLVHNIKHTSKAIKSSVDYLYDIIKEGRYKEKDLFDKLHTIKYNAEKVLRISSIITRANFKADQNHQVLDLVKYISQYLDIYNDIFEKSKMQIVVKENNIEFTKRINPLDISLLFDDLISNSEKANAKKVLVEFKRRGSGMVKILISDDGKGVIKRFQENPEAMFELGVTETNGSGIGLNSVKKSLKSMHGEIKFIGNNKILKGATFEITIQK